MFSLVATLAAQPSVVSPPWKTVQVPAELAEFYADHLARALRREGFKVVAASEVTALLSLERQKQLLGCSNDATSCLAALGAAMGCDAVLLVSLAKLDESYRGNVKLISASDGGVLAETQVEATSQKGLLGALDAGAHTLAQAMPKKLAPAPGPEVTTSGSRRLWWVPALAAGLGAAAGAVGLVGAEVEYAALVQTFSAPHEVSDADRQRAGASKTLQIVGWAGVGVTAAALLSMAGLLVFGTDAPVTPSVAFGPAGATLSLGVSLP